MTRKSATYYRIIDHAGPIFAEKGFALATGKAICEEAGVNAAAINYHFGSIDELYVAVLDRVANRLMDLDNLEAAINTQPDPVMKLSVLMEPIVDMLVHDSELGWMARLAGHEIVSSSMKSPILTHRLEQLGRLVINIIQALSSMPRDDVRLPLMAASFLGSLQWLFMADRTLIARMFPGLRFSETNRDELHANLLKFALAGIKG